MILKVLRQKLDCGLTIENINMYYGLEAFSLNAVTHIISAWLEDIYNFHLLNRTIKNELELASEYRTAVALELLSVKIFAILVYPIMPFFAESIMQSLGYREMPTLDSIINWIQPGIIIGPLNSFQLLKQESK
jgi:methionyl-tRNA synthetase